MQPLLDLSIVVPVYFSEGIVSVSLEALRQDVLGRNPGLSAEVIFVDDGSEDGSFQELLALREKHPSLVKVVKLTRNFGQVNAIMAGLSLASGKCAIVRSADDQDPAELAHEMLQAHLQEGYDIVICTRKSRDESALRRWTSNIFYDMIRRLSFPNMPSGGFDYFLLSRRAYRTILRNRDANPFLQGQILWTGFKAKSIEYRRRKRQVGRSRWTFARKVTYLIDGVMGYSFYPIRLMSTLGALVALLGFAYAAFIFAIRVGWGISPVGWAPLMITLLIIGGLQIMMLGVIGEYLWRILAQARNREPFVIDSLHGDFPGGAADQPVAGGTQGRDN